MVVSFLRKHIDQIIISFLFLSPIFDLITGLQERFKLSPIPLVYMFKVLFLGFLILYVLFISKSKVRTQVIYYLGAVVLVGFLFLLGLILNDTSSVLLQNIQLYIKAFYYPVVLVCMYCIYEKRRFKMDSRRLGNILVIYLLLMWAATVTNTGFNGYTQGKNGNVGWFYSMNEIGAILSILLPFLFLQIHRIKDVKIKIFAIIVVSAVYFGLGSKAPLLSLGLVCACYYVLYLIKLYMWKNFKAFYAWFFSGLIIMSLVVVMVPRTSFYKNIETHLDFLGIQEKSDFISYKALDRFVFSDRLSFFENEANIYSKQPIYNKLFGMGSHTYVENILVERKTVEIDYADIFYNFGIVGFIVYFYPIVLLWRYALKFHKGNKRKDIDLAIYFSALVLAAGLAGLTGHVLVAPSVSVLIAAIHILLIQKGKEQTYENGISNS